LKATDSDSAWRLASRASFASTELRAPAASRRRIIEVFTHCRQMFVSSVEDTVFGSTILALGKSWLRRSIGAFGK
jgi:hypothetical protein